MRKPLNRPGRDCGIADALDAAATQYPDRIERKSFEPLPRTEFRFGSLVVRCIASAPAIRAVAAKYRHGFRLYTPRLAAPLSLSMKRPRNADAVLAQLCDATED